MNKSFFEKKIDSDENERCKRNSVNNINTLIPKNYEESMNSKNAGQTERRNKYKELQNLYGNNVYLVNIKIIKLTLITNTPC